MAQPDAVWWNRTTVDIRRCIISKTFGNIVGSLPMIGANIAPNALPINEVTTGEVSDSYPSLFTPAGFTFAISGVIYLLLSSFCIYQARNLFSAQKMEMLFLHNIGWLFFICSQLNAAWIVSWHYLQIPLSFLILFVLLLTLSRHCTIWASVQRHHFSAEPMGWDPIADLPGLDYRRHHGQRMLVRSSWTGAAEVQALHSAVRQTCVVGELPAG